MTSAIDWTPLEIANGMTALAEMEGTPYYAAALALAKQNVDPKEAERRFLLDYPNRQGTARLFALTVRYLKAANVV